MSTVPEGVSGLTRKERQVAALADQDPLLFATRTAAEIAVLASTSEASVARTAKKLGFADIKEMKAACAKRVGRNEGLQDIIESRLQSLNAEPDHGTTSTAQTVLSSAASLLLTLNRTLDQEQLAGAVELCVNSRRVLTFGLGTGFHVAQYLSLEFERSGIESRALTGSGHTLADAVNRVHPEDGLIVMAPRVMFPDIALFLRAAASITAHVVVISQDELPGQLPSSVLHLRLPSTAAGAASESVCAWALSDVLVADVVRRNPQAAVKTRSSIQSLREQFRPEMKGRL